MVVYWSSIVLLSVVNAVLVSSRNFIVFIRISLLFTVTVQLDVFLFVLVYYYIFFICYILQPCCYGSCWMCNVSTAEVGHCLLRE